MKRFVCPPARVELQSSFKQILVQLTSGAVDDNFGQLSSKPVKKMILFLSTINLQYPEHFLNVM